MLTVRREVVDYRSGPVVNLCHSVDFLHPIRSIYIDRCTMT